MSSITPVKPGRSLRRRNQLDKDDSADGDNHLNFTSPDFKVNPNLINCKRNYQTTAKKHQAGKMMSLEKLENQGIGKKRRPRNLPESESFLREPPQFDKNHEIDLYERNLKEYTNNMDTGGEARPHES